MVLGTRGWLKKIRGIDRRDLISLDFQGLIKSGFICRLSGARRRIGFPSANLRERPARLFYTETSPPFPETNHVIAKNLHLLACLGIREERYDFPLILPQDAVDRVRSRLAGLGLQSGQILMTANVGAAWPTKRWGPDRWQTLLKSLKRAERFLLVLWGTPEEKLLAEDVGRRAGVPVAPFFNLVEVLALIKISRLLISGDTFALQAASALGVPVVGIFGPTTPTRNGPFKRGDAVAFHELPCSHCYRRSCPNPDCLRRVTAEEVADLAENLLKEAAHA